MCILRSHLLVSYPITQSKNPFIKYHLSSLGKVLSDGLAGQGGVRGVSGVPVPPPLSGGTLYIYTIYTIYTIYLFYIYYFIYTTYIRLEQLEQYNRYIGNLI